MQVDRRHDRQLLIFSFALSAIILFYRLTDFPLYFFSDEAVQGAEAQSLLTTGRDRHGVAWPLFIRGNGAFQLSLSVYWLLPFQALLGTSEFAVRASHAVASLIGTFAAALFVRRLLPGAGAWVLVPLVFYAAPVWYLHSRTGFELVVSASAWLVCIALFPLLWKRDDEAARSLRREIAIWSGFLAAFAFCFYSYTPARGWALLSLAVLLLAWLPASGKQLRRTLLLVAMVALIVTPYIVMAVGRPEVAFGRLHELGGNEANLLTAQRLQRAVQQLGLILDPRYWFSPETRFESSSRHMLPGLGLIPVYYLPFAALGLIACLRHFRTRFEARALVLLFPVGAFPAMLLEVNPLRCMPVGLVYLLWTAAGLAWLLCLLQRWLDARQGRLIAATLLGLQLLWLNHFVFAKARTAYPDYGFYDVQMGQREVFGWIRTNLARYPQIRLTHAAFNGNEALVDFYLAPDERRKVVVRIADAPCVLDAAETQTWILRLERMEALERGSCPVAWERLHTISDPRGSTLFVMVSIAPLAGFVPPVEAPR